MCLVLFAHKKHHKYKLILAANRDEFYDRPTKEAHFWPEDPGLLAGKDLTAGGTWLGVTRRGKIGTITNYRDLNNFNDKAPSRGLLVSEFLKGDTQGKTYLETLRDGTKKYNGYNLLIGTPMQLFYYSNYAKCPQEILPGIHGLSNNLLNVPWFKVEKGKKELEDLLKKNTLCTEDLFSLLKNTELSPDHLLPETGLDFEKEKAISSIFIATPMYGTRCSTLILVDIDNRLTFIERSFNPGTNHYSEKKIDIQLHY